MNNTVIDQGARDKIKQELGVNFLVEAGAGSGKTTSLTDRMVHLIYTGTCTIDQMAAITFTKKAADELKVRFQSKLEKTLHEEQNAEVKFLLEEALQNIERCFLGTVHSFCARLLRERPIEANLDLAFTELEEAVDRELLEEAWQQFLQKMHNGHSPVLEEMGKLGISIDDLFQTFCDLKEYPDVEWVNEHAEKPELITSYKALMTVVGEARRAIPDPEPEKGYDDLQKLIINAVRKSRHLETDKDKDIISLFELFDKNLKITQNRWHTKEDAKFYHGKINDLADKYVKPLLQAWREYCHPKAVSFLQESMQTYLQLKKERSLLNFQDLLLNTAGMLRDNAEVRQYFQSKYKYLLVDEFQDTDPIQAEIMFYLTGEDPAEKVWTKCRPKKGSLFVVGDPKQAIYRFRRADIDTYNRVKQLIEEHGGEVLQLTMNFRTVDAVTNELNKVFQHHLPEAETVYQAAYHPLHSFKKAAQGEGLKGIKRLTVPSEVSGKDAIIDTDAEQVAAAIRQLIDEGYKANDFMVLTRYTDGIAIYADKIEAKGIPVSISGEIIIGEMREFQELCILLKTFIDPTDEVSLVGALRGIFFGISDDELYQWKKYGGRFSLYSDTPAELPDRVKEKMAGALSKLREYQKWVRDYSPTIAIEKINEDIGFHVLLIQNGRNKQVFKSLLQIIEALRKREIDGQTTYKQVFACLTEMVYNKTTVINIEEDADAVRVMNVHKAKGLEAKIVVLAHPAKLVDPASFLSRHIKREDYFSKGYFAFVVKKGFQTKELALPIEWAAYKADELEYLHAEELRILYVAATRAEDALIISSSAKNNNKNPWNILFEIENIEEFTLRDASAEENTAEWNEVNAADYNAETSGRLSWLENRKEKSFDYWSPTKDKDYSKIAGIEREEGGGKDWGTIIHRVFEKVVKGEDVTNYIPSLLKQYDFPLEKELEVKKAMASLMRSDFWNELPSAELVLTEVPFALMVTKDSLLYRWMDSAVEPDHPFIVKGVIDLIYKVAGAWKIVDYKTDNPADPEHFKLLSEFYQDQISFYKQAWQEITGEEVVSEKLFFVMKENG